MAESTLTLSYQTLRRRIGLYLGLNRDSSYWTDDEESDVTDVIQEGLQKFYFPLDPRTGRSHRWSFLYPMASITTSGAYSTGTVVVASGVVTLTGGTMPDWLATDPTSGDLTINAVTYEISTYSSTTSVTLQDTSLTVTSATSYLISRPRYTLPEDFASYVGPLTFRPGTSGLNPPILIVDEATIRHFRQIYEFTYFPQVAAIVPKVMNAAEGQRWQLVLSPSPADVFYLQYRYQRIPNVLTAVNLYHHGGTPYSRAVLEACLSAAELQLDDTTGDHERAFQQAIAQAIDFDRRAHSVDRLGYCGDPGDIDFSQDALNVVDWTRGPVVYEGS